MKLISAEFKNFRLLRDLRLDFSTDSEKKLTVIRAENDTGKTTILNALQWAFYGNAVLPEKGKKYRLHPIDWDTSKGSKITISVQVDFEKKTSQLSRNINSRETVSQYRIIREQTLNGANPTSEVKLFKITDIGAEPIDPPDAWIQNELLRFELREVFFTDGDRALSFIEAESLTDKRNQVRKAIRSLLGIEAIEAALKHLKGAAAELNKDAKNLDSDKAELAETATELEQLDKKILDLEKKRDDAKLQLDKVTHRLPEIDKDIEAALLRGNREELERELKQTASKLKRIAELEADIEKAHSQLFRNLSLSRDLLAPLLAKSFEKLDALRAEGKLPSATIPVLEERLLGSTCICGESLNELSNNGKQRRNHIQHLIEESQKADELQRRLTDLYYRSLDLNPNKMNANEDWVAEYAEISNRRDELERPREEAEKRRKALEVKLEGIGDIDIQELRLHKQQCVEQQTRFNNTLRECEVDLQVLQKKHRSLTAERNNLIAKQRKGNLTLARLYVARDVEQALQNSCNRITDEELAKVGTLMNAIFLEMIGADPEQGAIIRKAEISEAFDILVSGPNNTSLNPDRDLNGASRRALTIAFILALTKVSEVKAPNIIDTPLGMMSGYVKRSVLKTAIRESSQLILFLTRAEIAGCEDILDAEVGQVITLTNSAHYPKILVNKPQVEAQQALRCECNHRQECELCKRRVDVEGNQN